MALQQREGRSLANMEIMIRDMQGLDTRNMELVKVLGTVMVTGMVRQRKVVSDQELIMSIQLTEWKFERRIFELFEISQYLSGEISIL
jgi:hypothetical protein